MFTVRPPADGEPDGWTHAIDWLGRLFDQVKAIEPPASALAPPDGDSLPPAPVGDLIGPYLEIAGLLGRRTADMHAALAADIKDPRFAPEPLGRDDLGAAAGRALAHAERTLASLEAALGSTPARVSVDTASLVQRVLEARRELFEAIRSIAARPAAAQREKQSPLKDVASMLRSFSYVAHATVLTRATATPDQLRHFTGWALSWNAWASASFLRAYLVQSAATPIGDGRDALLQFFMLDRSLRELDGELKNRTEWTSIPLNGLVELLGLR
jgi:maltose alpha-D-glucosyltransferase/alpha-amylase